MNDESAGNPSNYNLVRDRARRTHKATQRFGYDLTAFALLIESELLEDEPRTFKQACLSEKRVQWRSAMLEELKSLKENEIWTVVD